MAINILAQLAIGVAMAFVAYLIMPKPEGPEPPSLEDFEVPTSEAGRPIPVAFGSVTIKSPNLIGAWEKEMVKRPAQTSKK